MIRVLSSLALKGVLEKCRVSFEREIGDRLKLRFDATQAILQELKKGVRTDVLVVTTEAMEELTNSGRVAQAFTIGSSGVGVAVRAGAPKPDISSVDALKRSLESASSVAHSKVGASGIYFVELLVRLQITPKKRVVVEKGPVGLVVAAGDAEIGVQQLCELVPVPGIDIVGPLPESVQKLTRFSVGVPVNAANPTGGRSVMNMLPGMREELLEGGLQPA